MYEGSAVVHMLHDCVPNEAPHGLISLAQLVQLLGSVRVVQVLIEEGVPGAGIGMRSEAAHDVKELGLHVRRVQVPTRGAVQRL